MTASTQVLQAIHSAGSAGILASQICTDWKQATVWSRLTDLRRKGLIFTKRWPGGKRGGGQVRCFASQADLLAAYALVDPRRPKPVRVALPKPAKTRRAAPVGLEGAVVIPENVRRICVPYRSDSRYTVDRVSEPYFSGLPPGVYP